MAQFSFDITCLENGCVKIGVSVVGKMDLERAEDFLTIFREILTVCENFEKEMAKEKE